MNEYAALIGFIIGLIVGLITGAALWAAWLESIEQSRRTDEHATHWMDRS